MSAEKKRPKKRIERAGAGTSRFGAKWQSGGKQKKRGIKTSSRQFSLRNHEEKA